MSIWVSVPGERMQNASIQISEGISNASLNLAVGKYHLFY
jgi:hypothetical protein